MAVSGAATVNVLDETTTARVGKGAQVTSTSVGLSTPDFWVVANDDTTIVTVAGSLALSGSAGVGVGVDVATITKTTKAYIDSGVTANVDGDIDVKANVKQDITSVAAGIAAAGSVGATADASVHVITNTTKAFIGAESGTGIGHGDVHAEGSVRVYANDGTEVDKVVGAAAIGGTAAITLGGSVTVSNKTTAAFIGEGAWVSGNGATALDAPTGEFDLNASAAPAAKQYKTVQSDPGDGDVTFGNDGSHDTITRAGGDWTSDGFVAGQTIHVSGAGGNNGDFTIDSVNATTLFLTSNGKTTAGGPLTKTVVAYDPGARASRPIPRRTRAQASWPTRAR